MGFQSIVHIQEEWKMSEEKGEGAPDSKDSVEQPVVPVVPVVEPPINSIDRANEAVDRMKAENDRAEALLVRQEALRSEEILGGQADAGQVVPPVDPEQAQKDRVNKMLEGTGRSI